ncbi:bifunctional 5,10-methylenetetrahydrofolate dehydrogenase/5,10-methenyltetrahydrofolate cyclohydrolase [Pseudothermotoga sp. U03pept]|uniref:bifunctional 5,10-methylenetetrahydrofolate dehydrogenase/5,10-methenyltetrahydrofolate cyclohydrolase n=1 Tax=Pseudothermotoga sp. U03pept TaxID=3447012 RepID=UPI00309D6115
MLIDCKSIAQSIDGETVSLLNKVSVKPRLLSLSVRPDDGTISYLKSQKKKADSLGIEYETIFLQNAAELKHKLVEASENGSIHGIFVSHPLPPEIDETEIAALIDPRKDVEGRNPLNMGYLVYGYEEFSPCTAAAAVKILTATTDLVGKKVAVVGRSITVGLPVSIMLLRRDRSATVTVCHSKTKNLGEITKDADAVVVAVGKAGFLTPEMVKDDCIVIDVGINVIDGKVVGDVDRRLEEKVRVTPVPGGVGVVTTSILMNRVVKSALRGEKS